MSSLPPFLPAMFARLVVPMLLGTALFTARPAAAQMRDLETPTPRIWPVVLVQPLDEAGAALLHEVATMLELLPGQVLATRRVQTAAPGASEAPAPGAVQREVAFGLTAAQLKRLRAWQLEHPQQAGRLGLGPEPFQP